MAINYLYGENESGQPEPSSFDGISDEDLERHLDKSRYGTFELTDAVRPSYDLRVTPREGYRHDEYEDEEDKSKVPVLMIAASRENLFELFMDLIEPIGLEVDVVLETSHRNRHHADLYREHIDMSVLQSWLWDHQDLLENDGFTGIAVLNPDVPTEVQFDEHKLLIAYGHNLEPYEEILNRHGIPLDEKIKFITEAEHVHSSSDAYERDFDELRTKIGLDCHVIGKNEEWRGEGGGDEDYDDGGSLSL
ncbi:MAG: hypothetical protein QF442_01725 [Candidatus Peribacteraceae bacterium]|jgi:hypothetical protein|nr:hypothetical protein [Candidatus Peribacteraceae bacterium]